MSSAIDTIAAKATPAGRGGIGIVRVSGPMVLEIAQRILGRKPVPRQATFNNFFSQDGNVIDQGLALYFNAPHSFTGEEVLELQGHGGKLVLDLVLVRVLELGARLAKPGEFMERAFLNHKLDLTQAEAVADLINAATTQAAKNAIRSLQGEFSKKIGEIVNLVTALRIKIEAAIDFVEEQEIIEITKSGALKEVEKIIVKVQQLQKAAEQGVMLQEGVKIVIAGAPNAGKSTLFNCLSGREVAIVTEIPGTTRDVLQVQIELDGVPVCLLDTAGICNSADLVEKEGVRRAWQEIKNSDHLLLLIDATSSWRRNPEQEILNFSPELPQFNQPNKVTLLYNKIDLTGERAAVHQNGAICWICLSLKSGAGVSLLKEHLKTNMGLSSSEGEFSARRRHLTALNEAEKLLKQTMTALFQNHQLELIAEELRQIQIVLGEITGEVTADDLLDRIFSEFCLGK